MKNKKFVYVLLTCVAALWGVIFVKIYGALANKESQIIELNTKKPMYLKLVSHENDRVVLNLAYRNPFSKNEELPVENEPISGPLNTKMINKIPVKAAVDWSKIQYTGYINNALAKQKIAIIFANGKEFMLAEGQESNGIKLLKYAKDSVRLAYQKEVKFIRLK